MNAAQWRKADATAFATVLNAHALDSPELSELDFLGWHVRGQRFRVPAVANVQVGFGRVSIGRAVPIPTFNRTGMAPVRSAILILEVFLSAFPGDEVWQPIFNASLDALIQHPPTECTVADQLFQGPDPQAIPNSLFPNFGSVTGTVPYWANN